MKTPFDYINKEKVDLSRQDHRDEIIKRNKKLESAVKNGMSYGDFNIEVNVTAELNCLKCGNHVEHTNYHIEFDDDVEDNVPVLKCSSCETEYVYDRDEEVFYPRLKHKKQRLIK
ncbi:hypothetical protein ABMY20_15220 [Tenacibaculum sp. SSH1-16]|uniref:hypothetical protein n=1 Tax=Tenacibaculum sp. SSH1-16 TaxID=3136667 RepID=UPI0032C419CF